MKIEYCGHSKKSGVYEIICLKNGKKYIGSAKEFKERASSHLLRLKKNKHFNKHLQASYNKYGPNCFVFRIVETVTGDKLARTSKEEELIKYIGMSKLFNKTDKCKQPEPKQPSTNYLTDEYKKRMSESAKGRTVSAETRKKIGAALKVRWKDPTCRENFIKQIKERRADPEYKNKASKKSKEKWQDKQFVKNHPQIDKTIYQFVHKSGNKESCTRTELRKKYKLIKSSLGLVVRGKQKIHKGWSVVYS